MQSLNNLLINFFNVWIFYLEKFWHLAGFIFGICLILFWLTRKMAVARVFSTAAILLVIFQPVLYFSLPYISFQLIGKEIYLEKRHIFGFSGGTIVGIMSVFLIIRYLSPVLERIKNSFTKISKVERNRKTDIRQIGVHLPDGQKQYAPHKYFDIRKGIFFGLDEKKRPVYVQIEKWRKSHIEIVGTTGCGKGIAAAVMLTQAINSGECVIVLDPKNDEFLPHVLYDAAKNADIPFAFVDLLADCPQWNPLQNKKPTEIDELFTAGFSLGEKGSDADFYRLDDRRAARVASNLSGASQMTLSQMLLELMETQTEISALGKKFISDLEEISLVKSTNISIGLDIAELIKTGGVIYIRGSMRNPRILKLQKIFLISVMQHIESRDRESARHTCIFLDEFKYLISRPALEALGAIRDKCAHVVIAHQSLGDLRDCPSDLNAEAVVASVNENCSIKIAYAVKDPDTADWLAKMSGMILVDDEIREVKTNVGLTEVRENGRSLRQADRNLVDTNMLKSLPDRCAVLYGVGLARFFFASPILVEKNPTAVTPVNFDTGDSKTASGNDFSRFDESYKTIAQSLLDV